ncbi:hypothetical protein ACP3V3_02880 [Vibrio sp. PNB22_3_1]
MKETWTDWEVPDLHRMDLMDIVPFRDKPIGINTNSNLLERVKEWRAHLPKHPIFMDAMEDATGETDIAFHAVLTQTVDRLKEIIRSGIVLTLASSMGKDSSVVCTLFFLAYAELKNEGFTPKHKGLLLSTDTGIEQPEVSNLARFMWNKFIEGIAEFGLAIEMRHSQPNFSESFLGTVATGRTLPTTISSHGRPCAKNYKVNPGQRVLNQYKRELKRIDPNVEFCLMTGSRDEEGPQRAASIMRFGGNDDPLEMTWVEKTQQYCCYPIKSLSTSNVWEILTCAGTESKVLPSMVNFDKTVEVYADSAGGECVFLQEDTAKTKACGARHGCSLCCASGESDKSMDNLLENEKYAYLRPLARIRNFLFKGYNDWDERNVIARSINQYGYAKLQPEAFSFKKCRQLVHAMLSADCLEQIRAQELEYDLLTGNIPATEHNVRMSKPQFQLISQKDLLLLEFSWSIRSFSTSAFEAVQLWDRVYNHQEYERLEFVDEKQTVPSSPIPEPLFVFVGKNWSDNGLIHGLRDHMLEMVLSEPDSALVCRTSGSGHVEFTCQMETESTISVDNDIAKGFIESTSLWRNRFGELPASGALTLLRMGIVKVAKGHELNYQRMAQCAGWWRDKGLGGDWTMSELMNAKSQLRENGVELLDANDYISDLSMRMNVPTSDPRLVAEAEKYRPKYEVFTYLQSDLFSETPEEVTVRVNINNKSKKPKPNDHKVKGQMDIFS